MKLNEIRDNRGATQARKRVGRGIGSGLGKTSGRGGKGQTARSGVSLNGFEGGQTPIYRRLPKRGFNNVFAREFQEINLDRLQKAIDEKRVSADTTIRAASLVEGGVLRRSFDGIRLLGEGKDKFNAKLTIEVAGASKSAVEAIEKAGGKVIVLPEIRESVIKAADARRERRAKRAQKNAKPSGKPAEKPAEKPAS
jgi:large subunit ribosomal protein L15